MKKFFIKTKFSELRAPYSDLRGLTFIELIVVATIFSILAAVALFQFGGFTSNVSLQNLSQDIALRMVQAQKDGSSGSFPRLRQITTVVFQNPPSSLWIPTFGMYFEVPQGIPSTGFVYFYDNNSGPAGDGLYGSSLGTTACTTDPMSECLDEVTITSGDKISALCVYVGTACTSVEKLSITFRRPNLAARIETQNPTISSNTITYAQITVQSKNGQQTKTISVYPIGQITVD